MLTDFPEFVIMMNISRKSNTIIICLIYVCLSFSCKKGTNPFDTIIPQPVKIEQNIGKFTISHNTSVSADTEYRAIANYFIGEAEKLSGIKIRNDSLMQGNIILKALNNSNDLGDEGYILHIKKKNITIWANKPNGIFYGIQTLLQLVSADSTLNIPCGKVTDKPRFAWRGYMLDVACILYPEDQMKKNIDLLAMHKLNILHLHLTDDRGWRIEINKYNGFNNPVFGGFYTQDEIKELIEYAASRYITIIPEIEMPGHSYTAIKAYPIISCFGDKSTPPAKKRFSDPLCAGNEKTFEILEGVLTEVMDLFPAKYIHIGGDECNKTAWTACSKCQKRIKDEGLKSVEDLQSYFIKRIEKFVISKGKSIIGWDEILQGGLAPQATVMSWRGEAGGIEAAKQGHNVIMAPRDYLYFDYYQRDDKTQDPTGIGISKINKLDNVYQYDPIPSQLNCKEAKHVLGVQACLWGPAHEERTLPRLCALSEIAWSPKENKNYSGFLNRMRVHYVRLLKYDYNFYLSGPDGLVEYEYFHDNATIKLSAICDRAVIRYTLDNSEPDKHSQIYTAPIVINNNTIIKARTFLPNGRSSYVATSIIQRANNILPLALPDSTPGLNASYSRGIIESVHDIKSLTIDSTFILNGFVLPVVYDTLDYFAIDYLGYINIKKDGVYKFYVTSDDGTALYLNGNLLIHHDGRHGKSEKAGKIWLSKGFYKIRLLYFDNHFKQYLKLEYESEEIKRKEIPDEVLYH